MTFRLKHVVSRNDGGIWGDDPDGVRDVVVLRSTEQTVGGGWRIAEPAVRAIEPIEASQRRLVSGDILVTKSSGSDAHIGKASLVDDEMEELGAVFSNFNQRIRLISGQHPRFYWYFMNSAVARSHYVVMANSTSGLGNLNASILGELPIPSFDLPTQKAIADFLDRETARIDQLIEKKQRLVELLEEKRTSSIIHAITGYSTVDESDTVFPKTLPGWRLMRLRYCIESAKNGSWGSEAGEDELDVVCLRVADFDWSNLSISLENLTTRSISRDQFQRLTFRRGDILLEKSGGGEKTPVGRVVQFPGGFNAICSNFVARIRPTEIMLSDYLLYLLTGLYLSGYSHQFIKQNTGIQNLDDGALFDTRILVPSIEVQKQIVVQLNGELQLMAQLQDQINQSISRLTELRSALITAAVTGQIEVGERWRWGESNPLERALQREEAV